MRGTRRLRSLQRNAEAEHTLTLEWYSPGGTATGADGMERRTGVLETTTRGKVQSISTIPGVDVVTKTIKIGQTEVPVMSGGVHIPIGELIDETGLRVKIGWECVVAACGPYDDQALLGSRYRVVAVPKKTHATARRLDVVDLTHLKVS